MTGVNGTFSFSLDFSSVSLAEEVSSEDSLPDFL